jgi:hypothetical protein
VYLPAKRQSSQATNNQFGMAKWVHAHPIPQVLSQLTMLDLASNYLINEGIEALCPCLAVLTGLKHLDLSGNYICKCDALSDALCRMRCLIVLNLARNFFMCSMQALEGALIALSVLHTLNLDTGGVNMTGCSPQALDESGLASLCRALAHNNTLVSLNICVSDCMLSGLSSLAQLLRDGLREGRQFPLEYLTIVTDTTAFVAPAFLEAVMAVTSLKRFKLEGCQLPGNFMRETSATFSMLALQELCVDCRFSHDGSWRLGLACRHCIICGN